MKTDAKNLISQMTRAMMQFMPLNSIQSFLPVTDEQLEGILDMFRAALAK